MGGIDSRTDSQDLPDTGSARSPDSGRDGVAILDDVLDGGGDASSGRVVDSDGAAGDSSGGFSVPERHRVEPRPESADEWDKDSWSGGEWIPPEFVPEGTFVLRETAESPLLPDQAGDAQRFPSEQADRRAEGFARQGKNDLDYRGTCSLASSAEMLSDLTGERVTENAMVNFAVSEKLCETDSSDATRLGASDIESVKTMQRGLVGDAFCMYDCDTEDLAHLVDSGDGVCAAVKAAECWPDEAYPSQDRQAIERAHKGTDHMVWVTGVSRDPTTQLVTGFYVNDTGRDDGARRFLSSAEMKRAWENRGGQVVVAPSLSPGVRQAGATR